MDSENNNTWMYFKLKLRETIREIENLVFVYDRHISIAHALSTVFLEAHHGACTYHIKMNINHKFKIDHCDAEFDLVVYAYHVSEFQHHFEKTKVKNPRVATLRKLVWRNGHVFFSPVSGII